MTLHTCLFCVLDERIAVENTTIPEHLAQMIEVLKIEEQENGFSSAVSYIYYGFVDTFV